METPMSKKRTTNRCNHPARAVRKASRASMGAY